MRHLGTLALLSLMVLFLGGCASNSHKQVPEAPVQMPEKASAHAPTQSQSISHFVNTEFAGILFRNDTAFEKPPSVSKDNLWQRLRDGFELPRLNNDRVAYYEKSFTRNPEHFYAMLTRAKWFLPYILTEIEKRGYPSELALLPAVESSYITHAKSKSKASGLWQFIPSTGRLYGLNENWWYDGRRDPVRSTQAALDFLGELEQRFDGDWFLAIAGYNAGGGNIEKAIRKNKKKRRSTHFNDLPLRRETSNYVPKLIAFRNIFRNPERYGLTLPDLGNAQQFSSLDAGSQTDLNLLAQKAGLDRNTLYFLNSAYLRNVTPPSGPHIIYLPVSGYKKARSTLSALSQTDRLRWAHYRVKSGDVLGRIATQHGVSVAAIQQSNKLNSNLIHPGDILLIPDFSNRNSNKRISQNTRKRTNTARQSPPRTGNAKLTHHVQKGDTLWGIAQRYGVKVAQISQWNQINQSITLKLGQKLTIYTPS